jgi:hypothetical protein
MVEICPKPSICRQVKEETSIMSKKAYKNRLRSKEDIHLSPRRFDNGKSNLNDFENESSLAHIPLELRKREAEKPLFLTRYE